MPEIDLGVEKKDDKLSKPVPSSSLSTNEGKQAAHKWANSETRWSLMAKVAVKAGVTVKVLNTWYCTFSDSQIKQGTPWEERPGDSTVPGSNSLVIGSPGVWGGTWGGGFPKTGNGQHCGGSLGKFEEVFTNQYRKISLFHQPVQKDITILITSTSLLVPTISYQLWGLSDWWWAEDAKGAYYIDSNARKGLSGEVTFQLRPEWQERENQGAVREQERERENILAKD